MNRKFFSYVFLLGLSIVLVGADLFATNLDYMTNVSPEFFSNPSGRCSAQDGADTAMVNPAGTIRMGSGLFTNFSNQMVIKKYTIEDRQTGGEYESNTPDLIVPNLYIVWNPENSDFNLWGHLGLIGGGGTLYYSDGAPVVNRVLNSAMVSADLAAAGAGHDAPFSGYTAAQIGGFGAAAGAYDYMANQKYHFSVLQKSYQICQSIGTTYAIGSNLSVAFGVRVIESSKTNQIFQSVGAQAAHKFIDVDMTANGAQCILGVNFAPVSDLNLALTYDSMARMNYKVNVKSNGTDKWGQLSQGLTDKLGMEDGKTYRYDMPHRFTLGARYSVTPAFDITLMGQLYIERGLGVKIETGTNDTEYPKYLSSYAYELGIGYDWKLTDRIQWSAGFVWDNMNQNDDYMNEVMYHNNVYVVNTGFKFKVDDKTKINIGFGRNFMRDAHNDSSKAYGQPGADNGGIQEPALANANAVALSNGLTPYGENFNRNLTFKKETWVTAVGVEYKWL